MSFSFSSLFPVFLGALSASPAIAIPPNEISEKLNSVIVFAPVSPETGLAPLPLDFELEGAKRSVYFAAFSPSAVQQLIKERISKQDPNIVKGIKFAPLSLAKFDETVQTQLADNSNNRVIYVPDPDQVPITEKLLIDQGTKPSEAKQIASLSPSVFCPSPSITATPNSGPLKGESFIPCSTDYGTVKGLIDKGISDSPSLKDKGIKVLVFPISNFAGILATQSEDQVGDIRILPTPSSLKAIEALRERSKK